MNFTENELNNYFLENERKLFEVKRVKFLKSTIWRKDNVPDEAGIYAIFENSKKLVYIGESGNLRKRMSELGRTVNHTFRRQIAIRKFNAENSKTKYNLNIELELDRYFEDYIYIAFLPVNFGRLEFETYLVDKHQAKILNSVKRRK